MQGMSGNSEAPVLESSELANHIKSQQYTNCRIKNPDMPRAGRDGAAHGGTAGRGWAGRDADGSVRQGDDRPSHPPDFRRKPLLGVPLEKRISETPWKQMEEQKPHLTRDLTTGRRPLLFPGC